MTIWPAYARSMGPVVVAAALSASVFAPADAKRPVWKGAETFAPFRLGPNPERCGPAPANVEAEFVGTGIDTVGGTFAVAASGCLDTVGAILSDVEATDVFTTYGASVSISAPYAPLVVDPVTCVATNAKPAPFTVTGGTGRFAGSTGSGTYDIAFVFPGCAAPQQPVHVWFSGHIDTR